MGYSGLSDMEQKEVRLIVECSEGFRWYSNVFWVEKNCLVDCLVSDIQNVTDGHYVLEINRQLSIYSFKQLCFLDSHYKILGKAIKWSLSF